MKNPFLQVAALLILGLNPSFGQNTFPTGAGTNVGIGTTSPTTRLQVTSATAGTSGVRLTNLTSSSATTTGNNKALSVDATGNIVLVPVVNSGTNIYNSDGTLTADRILTMNGRSLTFNPSTANSQFFINGTSGFVGLGTVNPTSRLEVTGIVKANNLFATNISTNATNFASGLNWYNDTYVLGAGYEMTDPLVIGATRRMLNFYDQYGKTGQTTANDDKFILNIIDRANKQRFRFVGSKVGSPSNGNLSFQINDKNEVEIFKILDDGNDYIRLQMAKPNTKFIIGGYSDYVPGLDHKFIVQNGSALIEGNILTNANIGIGTSNFTDGADTYRLSVNGAIRANRVKVYTTWADYVFEKDYNLPTLEEVEKHISEKGHLQDIPSAREVEENGIELGEMNKLLLQKIEELTLYVIDLNKEVNGLKQQLKK